jgi:hypothetical protein
LKNQKLQILKQVKRAYCTLNLPAVSLYVGPIVTHKKKSCVTFLPDGHRLLIHSGDTCYDFVQNIFSVSFLNKYILKHRGYNFKCCFVWVRNLVFYHAKRIRSYSLKVFQNEVPRRGYLDQRKIMEHEVGKIFIVRYLINCALHPVWLKWSSQRVCDGCSM